MKQLLAILASVLLACPLSFAQNRVIDSKPAHDGKDLTMEEAIFKGVDLPKLSSKTGKYNWLMGLAMCLSFGTMFCVAMKTPAGIGVGIAMGIAMGLCFTESFYFYEGAVTEEAKTAEA